MNKTSYLKIFSVRFLPQNLSFLRGSRIITIGTFIALLVCIASLLPFYQSPKAHAVGNLAPNYTWHQLKIGGGGFVTGMAIHPTTPGLVYARTDTGGALKWDEGTQTWTQLLLASAVPNPVASDYGVESVAISQSDDQQLFLAVGSDISNQTGRILKSTNQGRSWTDGGHRWYMAGNGDYRTGSERLAVDPHNSNVLYFGSRKEGLWVSTDGASSWNQIPTNQIPIGNNSQGTPAGVKFVVFDPNSSVINGRTSRIFVGVAGVGVYRSDDAGSTWSNFFVTNTIPYDGKVASNGTFYVSLVNPGGQGSIHRYTPSTGALQVISPLTNQTYWQFAVDPKDPQRIFAGPGALGDKYFFRTTNGGLHWDALDLNLASADIPWILRTDEKSYMTMADLVFDPFVQDRLWFAQGTGVWRTTDLSGSTITWNFISKGIEQMVADDVIAPGGSGPVTAVMDRIGFAHPQLDAYPTAPILTNKFASGTSLEYSGKNPNFIAAVASDHRGLNPDQSGYSTDGGKSWTQFSGSRNYSDLFGGNIAVSATNTDNMVWLPTWNRKPYSTTDRGATWTKSTSLDAVGGLHGMIWWPFKKALDADKVAGSTFYIYSTDNGGEFFRSFDGGQTWNQAPGQAPTSTNNDAHVFGQIRAVPGYEGNVWASVAQGGLYYTQDKGDSWTKVSGVQEARSIGFGKALAGSSYPAIYIYGKVNDQQGIWRSADRGASWDLVAAYPADIYDAPRTINGDMSIAGRVYVGLGGSGFVYGDQQSSSGSNTSTTLTPIADRDYDSGTLTYFNVSKYTTAGLKFDLSGVQGSIASAKLRVYRINRDQQALTLNAFQVNDDSWDEASVRVMLGSAITSVNSDAAGYVEIDVTAFVQTEQAGDKIVSIGLTTDKPGWQGFYSRENSSNQPQLLITTS